MSRLLILCWLAAPALCAPSFLDAITAVKNDIEEAIVTTASSQCSLVKKLLGLEYGELIESNKEPELDSVTIDYISNNISITYNMDSAGELIPKTYGYNPDQNLYLFIHGFTSSPKEEGFSTIRNALFSQGDCNVLALDSSQLINFWYLRSSTYVSFIGEKLGRVLAALVESGVDPTKIHIIGHSLGAHIAAFSGKTFTSLASKKVGRISGLDPAGPCFSNVNESLRLQSTDASFVDVIHSDAGILGLNENVGQVDYWPNGGTDQPKCVSASCSHSRSWEYYAASIVNSTIFPAVKCDSWSDFKKGNCDSDTSYMGFGSVAGTTGTYYLQTSGNSPYGLGQKGIKYNSD